MQRLMIVDDSQIICNQIERGTSNMPIEVVAIATDGEEAVNLFNTYRPDLITMDLNMPKIDGLTTIRQIVAIDSRVNILVISAMSDRRTGLKALESGARGFIRKPFTEEELFISFNKLRKPRLKG